MSREISLDIAIWEHALTTDPLWHITLENQWRELFFADEDKKTETWREDKERLLESIADLLKTNRILFGPNTFDNDDDRPLMWHFRSPEKRKPGPIGAVIHHTSTPPDASDDFIGAITLFRVIVNDLYRGRRVSVDIGHPGYTRNGRQEPVPYHTLVRQGQVVQVLRPEHTGLHAGKYDPYNIETMGIAWVGDATNTPPPRQDQDAIRDVLSQWKKDFDILYGVGHCQVPQITPTQCPGNTWPDWVPPIIAAVGLYPMREGLGLPAKWK